MDEKDIAPELLERIRADFLALLGDAQQEADTYTAAAAYAELVGSALADAFRRNLTADILPDGRLYWNIADRVVRPLLEEDYARIADAAAAAQQALNRQARIGIAPQRAVLDADRVNGLLNKLAEAERFEDAAWALAEPVRTFSRMAVDDVLKANVDFQGRAGLRPRVVRIAESGCCKWCSALAGTYDYPHVPKDVYRRHERCRCRVEYDPGSGRRQNVWNKTWTDPEERDKIKARKQVPSALPTGVRPRSSGEVGFTDGDTTINSVEPLDFSNKASINRQLITFLEQHSNSPVEHAIVFSPDGHVYRLTGTHATVNTALIGEDSLMGSIGAHNHPVWEGFLSGDSFSMDDVCFSVEHKTGTEFLTTGNRRYSFEYTGDLNREEIAAAYKAARLEVQNRIFDAGESIEFIQLETMRILAGKLKGFDFHELV